MPRVTSLASGSSLKLVDFPLGTPEHQQESEARLLDGGHLSVKKVWPHDGRRGIRAAREGRSTLWEGPASCRPEPWESMKERIVDTSAGRLWSLESMNASTEDTPVGRQSPIRSRLARSNSLLAGESLRPNGGFRRPVPARGPAPSKDRKSKIRSPDGRVQRLETRKNEEQHSWLTEDNDPDIPRARRKDSTTRIELALEGKCTNAPWRRTNRGLDYKGVRKGSDRPGERHTK